MDDKTQRPGSRGKGPFAGNKQRRSPSPRRDRRPEERDETMYDGGTE